MISVIIPVYNVEPYLEKCLNSVLTNSYRDLEIICVNDGSTDGCLGILRRMEKQDPRIIVIDQENRGLPEARNSGLEVATGEYTTFIDADDWVHPRYFQSLLTCMEETGADMVVSGVRRLRMDETIEIDPDLEPSYRRLSDTAFYEDYFARHMVWGRLFRKRDTESLRFPPEVVAAQDTLYNLRAIAGWRQPIVYKTDAELYFYLSRPGSLISSHPYYTYLELVDWYMANGRDPRHRKTGDWGWTLALQSITMALSSRYSAYLWKNRELIKHSNILLRALLSDLFKDRNVRLKYKLTRMIMYLFPCLYRRFRLLKDPTLRDHERQVRQDRDRLTAS